MNDPVPFFSAQAVNKDIDVQASVARVIARNHYVLGAEVASFEQGFAAYCGVPHCVGVGNGTDALELSLRALGVGSGDEVALAPNAGFYGSTALRLIGAVPTYVDVDAQTLALCPRALEAQLCLRRPAAIIVTHLYGQLAAVEDIVEIAARHGVPLIEDVAQAHGARRGGRTAGSFGALGCFSFYPTKNLGALGDGGAVVSADGDLAGRVRSLRQYGWGRKYHNELPFGRNSRLDELQAAVLNDKLPHLDQANEARRAIARSYRDAFAGLPLRLPASLSADHVVHLYVVRTPRRDDLRGFLSDQGIAADIHFPVPDHRQAIHTAQYAGVSLPEAESACATVLSLPCYPAMPPEHVEKVASAVRGFFLRPAA
ncbi:MAG: DegT/DnrJ/EryC1/StrS family aminotransferase [Pseudomonadota bacterium]|nr:DegT/DnrJ/EryC1/StrS family aminotransferase [Pseudomonadota bacterium]